MQVVGLRAPDAEVAEARFRARLSSTTEGGVDGGGGGNERFVRLAMELVHGKDFGVAEEANEVLRCVRRVWVSFQSSNDNGGKRRAVA